VCVMDDILEHSAAGSAKYMAQILSVLLQAAQDKVSAIALFDLRLSACRLLPDKHAAQHRFCCKSAKHQSGETELPFPSMFKWGTLTRHHR